MAREIERKFLVVSDSWKKAVERSERISQGYLCGDGGASVRIRIAGDMAFLNIKSATLGVSRHEYEYPIPFDDAREMLDVLCGKPLIEKTRHHVRYSDHLWEVDVFEGENAGLVVAEVELDDENEPFARPEWAGAEVSHDPRYYNVCLARHPYREW